MFFKQTTPSPFIIALMLMAGTSSIHAMNPTEEQVTTILKARNEALAARDEAEEKFIADIRSAKEAESVKQMNEIIASMGKRTLNLVHENPYYSMTFLNDLKHTRDTWAYKQAQDNLTIAEAEESVEKLDAIIHSLGGTSENIVP